MRHIKIIISLIILSSGTCQFKKFGGLDSTPKTTKKQISSLERKQCNYCKYYIDGSKLSDHILTCKTKYCNKCNEKLPHHNKDCETQLKQCQHCSQKFSSTKIDNHRSICKNQYCKTCKTKKQNHKAYCKENKNKDDESISDTDESISDTDKSISDTDESISDTDESISDTDESISDTDESISDTDESINDTDESICDTDESICDTDESISDTDESIDENIYNTDKNTNKVKSEPKKETVLNSKKKPETQTKNQQKKERHKCAYCDKDIDGKIKDHENLCKTKYCHYCKNLLSDHNQACPVINFKQNLEKDKSLFREYPEMINQYNEILKKINDQSQQKEIVKEINNFINNCILNIPKSNISSLMKYQALNISKEDNLNYKNDFENFKNLTLIEVLKIHFNHLKKYIKRRKEKENEKLKELNKTVKNKFNLNFTITNKTDLIELITMINKSAPNLDSVYWKYVNESFSNIDAINIDEFVDEILSKTDNSLFQKLSSKKIELLNKNFNQKKEFNDKDNYITAFYKIIECEFNRDVDISYSNIIYFVQKYGMTTETFDQLIVLDPNKKYTEEEQNEIIDKFKYSHCSQCKSLYTNHKKNCKVLKTFKEVEKLKSYLIKGDKNISSLFKMTEDISKSLKEGNICITSLDEFYKAANQILEKEGFDIIEKEKPDYKKIKNFYDCLSDSFTKISKYLKYKKSIYTCFAEEDLDLELTATTYTKMIDEVMNFYMLFAKKKYKHKYKKKSYAKKLPKELFKLIHEVSLDNKQSSLYDTRKNWSNRIKDENLLGESKIKSKTTYITAFYLVHKTLKNKSEDEKEKYKEYFDELKKYKTKNKLDKNGIKDLFEKLQK